MIVLRDFTPNDYEWGLDLNNKNAPEVGFLTEDSFEELLPLLDYLLVAEVYRAGKKFRAGLFAAMREGTEYSSHNYSWFSKRYDRFLYCDRVVVDQEFRDQGIGATLYQDMFSRAQAIQIQHCLCEVNEDPPNPHSMRFHQRLGFKKIDLFDNKDSGKKVNMLEKRIDL
jgi:predicted GNAT superfamily acetyltransferase